MPNPPSILTVSRQSATLRTKLIERIQSVHKSMKPEIHPDYFPNATITCSCGAVYKIGSTKEDIQVESCAACHPFYTGKQKLMDTARRVEKFTERTAQKATVATGKKVKKEKRAVIKKAKAAKAEK